MLQAGDGAGFAFEAGTKLRTGVQMSRENFDGDGAIEAGVAGAVDLAHASGADGRLNFVRPELRSRHERHWARIIARLESEAASNER